MIYEIDNEVFLLIQPLYVFFISVINCMNVLYVFKGFIVSEKSGKMCRKLFPADDNEH